MKEVEPLKWMAQIYTVSFIFIFCGVAVYKNFKSGESWRILFRPTDQWVAADDGEGVTQATDFSTNVK